MTSPGKQAPIGDNRSKGGTVTRGSAVDFSIIIVNYNSGELLKNCLDSIFRNIHASIQVMVYDNDSSDHSLTLAERNFPESSCLTIIRGKQNLGFAKASNLAAAGADGRFLHFLNPDTIVNRELDNDYQRILKGAGEGIWVTSLVDHEGTLLKNKHLIPRVGNVLKGVFGKQEAAFWNVGASVIVSRSVFDRLGGWPEETFMYTEDLELFYRAYLRQVPVYYLDTRIMHLGKGSSQYRWNDRERARLIEASFREFFTRHGAAWEYYLIRPVQLLYILATEPRVFGLYSSVFVQELFRRTR